MTSQTLLPISNFRFEISNLKSLELMRATPPAKMQGREATSQRHVSLVCAQSRSLKAARYGFAPLRLCGKLLLLAISLTAALFTGSHVASAQTPEDTLRVRTRVLFLDAPL